MFLMLQRDFIVRVQSKSALTASDIKVSNGDLQSVTPVSGTNSYDVSVSTKSQKAAVAVSTIASAAVAASTITVDVNTVAPQVILHPSKVWMFEHCFQRLHHKACSAKPLLRARMYTDC